MTLEFVVSSLDAVPEASRKFYTEKDGKFHLDSDLADSIKGLKYALERKTEMANENARKVKELETKYAGIDPDKTRELLAKLENDSEAQLIAQGKIDEVIQRRTEKWRADEERQKKELQAKIDAAEARANSFRDKVFEDAVRIAAVNAGVNKGGLRDAPLLARAIFTLNDDGSVVQKDSDGNIVLGRDGKTPFSLEEWFDLQRSESPHWFSVASTGSPATGSSSQAGVRQMKRATFDALSPAEKVATIKNNIRIVD